MNELVKSCPHVTICVPAYNAGRTLHRTLNSIVVQDYPDFDVLVCDNASTDDTPIIAKEYANRNVRYVLNPVWSRWAESNWNYVLPMADGPLIALYHADDIYAPTMVRRQVELLESHPETSAVFTMSQTIDEQDCPIRMGNTRLPEELRGRERFEFPDFFNATLKYCTFVSVPTMMTRRQVLDKVGDFRWQMFASASDIDLYLRMARQWGPVGIIDEPLHKYRISSGQGSALIARNRTTLFDFFSVMDAHLNDPEEKHVVLPQSLAFYELSRSSNLLTCAMNLIVQGKKLEAYGCLRDALKWQHVTTALMRPRMLVRLMIGTGFLISIYLGLGTFAGRLMSWTRARLGWCAVKC